MALIVALLSLVVVVSALFLCYYLFISSNTTADSSMATRDSRMKTWVIVSTVAAVLGMLIAVYGFTRINALSPCVTGGVVAI